MSDGINLPAHSDTTLDFDEFDDYIARMDVRTEEMLNQITLEDLL